LRKHNSNDTLGLPTENFVAINRLNAGQLR